MKILRLVRLTGWLLCHPRLCLACWRAAAELMRLGYDVGTLTATVEPGAPPPPAEPSPTPKLDRVVEERVARRDFVFPPEPRIPGPMWQLEHTNRFLYNVHSSQACAGRPCPIHNRTAHPMRAFPQNFRTDWSPGFMERVCPHGIGHPDPDCPNANSVHGCDGCCITGDSPLWSGAPEAAN